MQLVLLSFHVNQVGVEGLTRVALKSEDRTDDLRELMGKVGAAEGFYLSTCNRTEYLFAFDGEIPTQLSTHFELAPQSYRAVDEILCHLLEVSLSKDSVVFGESQILGQLKRAYDQALRGRVCGPTLSPLLNAVLREAKAIRTRVGLTQCHTSVATVAGHTVHRTLGSRPMAILFVGAGETNQIMARYLCKRTNVRFIWSSRTHERAARAAKEFGGEIIDWQNTLDGHLPNADVICVATHATEVRVHEAGLRAVSPKLVCDLSVPANVDRKDCESLSIQYYGIEELSEELSRSKQVSDEIIRALNSEITAAVQKISTEQHLRKSRSLFAETVEVSERILEKELEGLLESKLSNLPMEQKAALSEWSRRLVKKINHVQFQTLRTVLSDEDPKDVNPENANQMMSLEV